MVSGDSGRALYSNPVIWYVGQNQLVFPQFDPLSVTCKKAEFHLGKMSKLHPHCSTPWPMDYLWWPTFHSTIMLYGTNILSCKINFNNIGQSGFSIPFNTYLKRVPGKYFLKYSSRKGKKLCVVTYMGAMLHQVTSCPIYVEYRSLSQKVCTGNLVACAI